MNRYQKTERKICANLSEPNQWLLHEFQSSECYPHTHNDCCELIYLRQGIASIKVGGQKFNVHSGELIIIDAGAEHCGTYNASDHNGKFERYVLSLSSSQKNRFLPQGSSPVIQLDIPDILTAIFQLIEREYLAQENGWQDVCTCTLDALLTLVSRHASPIDTPPQEDLSQSQMLASDILDYLHVHYCEKISLQSVADFFYISPYYLSHLMKKYFQTSLLQYVIHLRISEAQVLLSDSKYPVKRISQIVGYPNPNYFISVFRKATGMSPNEYRACLRN